MMHLKDIFALFNAHLNRLTAIVTMKPDRQIGGDILLTIVQQNSPTSRIARMLMS